MSAITDFLKRLRPATITDNPSVPGSESAEPVVAPEDPEAALIELDASRAQTRDALAAAERRRRHLLIGGAGDAEIAKLDRDIDRLHTDLERLDEVEPILVAAVDEAKGKARKASFAEIVPLYVEALQKFGDAMHAAINYYDVMVATRRCASDMGHENMLNVLAIPINVQFDRALIDKFVIRAADAAERATLPPPRPPVFPIKFTQAVGCYRTGETAAFDALQAWKFIKAGFAVWATGTRRPPMPPELDNWPPHDDDLVEAPEREGDA